MLGFYYWSMIQIVLESLPISSSGHLFLLEKILNNTSQAITSYVKIRYIHMLHGPTLLVIAVLFFQQWFRMLRSPMRYKKPLLALFILGIIADSITCLWYGLFTFIGTQWFPLPIGFFITILILFLSYYVPRHQPSNLPFRSYRQLINAGFLLGNIQGIALLPGISRFAITFVLANYLGWRPQRALELSFALQTPLICAAFIRSFYQLWRVDFFVFSICAEMMSIVIMATIIAIFALWLTRCLIMTNRFYYFAWYMLIPFFLSLFCFLNR